MPVIVGIDIGTTTLKAAAFDETGRKLASAAIEPPRGTMTIDGCVAQIWSPEDLWERVGSILRQCTADLRAPVDCVAIAELGLVGFPIMADGKPGYPAISWMEPPDPLVGLTQQLDPATVFELTGNRLSPIYPPAWISWLRHHDPSYPRGREVWKWIYAGNYVAFQLCGEIAVDYSMASQSTALDQSRLAYVPEILGAYGLSVDLFPTPQPAGTILGCVTPAAAQATGIPIGARVVLGGADYATGAYGSGLLDPRQAAIITGSWECTVMCSHEPTTTPALERYGAICDPHVAAGRWSVRIENLAGDVAEWFRQRLLSTGTATSVVDWDEVIALGDRADDGAGGLLFLPQVFGSFGPIIDERARGAFLGVSHHTERRDLVRALFEGLSFQTRHSLESLELAAGDRVDRIRLTGGGVRNSLWTQTRVDALGRSVELVDDPDVTLRGAAMIASVGYGSHRSFEDAAREMAPAILTLAPNSRGSRHLDEIYHNAYLPALDAVSNVHHQLLAAQDHAPNSDSLVQG